jgi:hypothetical protein
MTQPPDRWRDYQKFRMDLIEETRRASLTPGQVASYLEARLNEFAGYIPLYEINAYRNSPDDWRGVVLPS